jgi:hypothetical protein
MMYEGVGRLEGGTNVAKIGSRNKASAEEAVVTLRSENLRLLQAHLLRHCFLPCPCNHASLSERQLRNGHIRVLKNGSSRQKNG